MMEIRSTDQEGRFQAEMKRVVITGSSASGKSTLARQLGICLALEVIHLDIFYWQPGWMRTPPDSWRSLVTELTEREAWIIEGNFSGTLHIQFAAADTIIFLDLPRYLCLWRAIKRGLNSTDQLRSDQTLNCPDQLNWSFLQSIWSYPNIKRPLIIQQLERHAKGKQVIILQQLSEVRDFLAKVKHDYNLPSTSPPMTSTLGLLPSLNCWRIHIF